MSAAPLERPTGTAAGTRAGGDVLTVTDLTVSVRDTTLVDGVDLTIGRGERVGLIGESGSCKSLTALAVMGLLPEDVRMTGSVRLAGVDHDLVGATERQMSRVRGRDVAMVFQEPMTALNPTMRVGDQVAEAMLIHATRPDRRSARAAAVELLDQVGLPDPGDAARAYPHQLSGGQRQRVMIAMAFSCRPQLVIADEPTTALDVTVQRQILQLMAQLRHELGTAILLITHDLGVVAQTCDRVAVMYAGKVVETAPVAALFARPRHPYTRALLASVPRIDESGAGAMASTDTHLPSIPGQPPDLFSIPTGCPFRPRCPDARAECEAMPGRHFISEQEWVRCWNYLPDEA
jgi:oligopeptide/dipeptide ABC transporter ATP-binding protein